MIASYDENLIYDESGLVVGRIADEPEPMYWCNCCDEFHVVGSDCPPPKHDARCYGVEEHDDIISRNAFVMEYLLLRDCGPDTARQFRNGLFG